jgi:Trk K+ transport system NAD-binding subunit
MLESPKLESVRDHVIVCGLGQVGFQVASLLLKAGEAVTVVTLEARSEWERQITAAGATVIRADARDPANLERADVSQARVVMACTAGDSANIEIALDAKRLNPAARVIVRIFDQNLAERLRTSFDMETISTAAVGGSAFALAGLGEHAVREFEIEGSVLTVVRLEVKAEHLSGKSVAEAAKVLGFPILLRIKGGETIEIAPAPDTRLDDSDVIKVLVPTASLRKIHKLEEEGNELDSFVQVMLRAINPLTLPRLLASIWTNTTPELRAVFVLVNFVILLSVAVFHFGMSLEPIDALYFVVSTVTTVGYGDITPIDATVGIKLFACVLMILGSASIAISYSIVTDYIVSQRLLQLGGRRRLPHHDHVVVVGLGDVGFRTAEELARSGARVVVMDLSAANPHVGIAQRRFATMIGDARDSAILKTAQVPRARAIVVTTNDDASNLSVGLAAKALNPKIRAVVRIQDGEFARKVSERTNLESLSSAAVAAPVFVGAALHEHALTSFLTGNQLVTLCLAGPDEPRKFAVGGQMVAVRTDVLA